jgi:putative transposase
MARTLRIERRGGVYHMINRGNYLQDLFINDGAHGSFESCLFEACEKCGWILEGFCVMTNHFHLVVRTPKGNLIYGMKWLQSTFANRYHKYRKVHGKLFQGRYKSLIVEEDSYLGGLLHYVHLNPVRAGMCTVSGLKNYRWSSYWYLRNPSRRRAFMDCSGALSAAGGLADTVAGRKKYQDYLLWLSTDDVARKELAFDTMCRGWALGSKDFKKSVLKEELEKGESDNSEFEGRSLSEANELIWEGLVEGALGYFGKTDADIVSDKKCSHWKAGIASLLKKRSSAPNTWITCRLNMGASQAVSRYVTELLKNRKLKKTYHDELCTNITE